MNIVVPMAGRGSRFNGEGFDKPKPLIKVAGKPMLIRALKSIDDFEQASLIIVALEEHQKKFKIDELLIKEGVVNFELVLIPEVTDGQLCTVLKAKNYFNQEKGLLIVPADTYISSNLINNIHSSKSSIEGIISVFDLPGERWSFAKTDEKNRVVEVTEKIKISNHASTGLYYFSNTKKFIKYAEQMVAKGERSKGEFYVMPLYQKYIDEGAYISISEATAMWDMGTPKARLAYENYLLNE